MIPADHAADDRQNLKGVHLKMSISLGMQVIERVRQFRRDVAQFEQEEQQLEQLRLTLLTRLEEQALIMAPLGAHAFVQANLVNTNSVMVLLGDGIFVKRTIAQALDILERRLVSC
jgi:prefoldin alpha subunit